MQKNRNLFPVLIISFFLVLLLVSLPSIWGSQGTALSWTEAKQHIADGDVKAVVFKTDSVVLEFEEGAVDAPPRREVNRVEADDDAFVALLDASGVSYRREFSGCERSGNSFSIFFLLGLFLLFYLFMGRREGGVPPGVATFGKSQARLAPEEGTGVTFADVAGIDEAIDELQEAEKQLWDATAELVAYETMKDMLYALEIANGGARSCVECEYLNVREHEMLDEWEGKNCDIIHRWLRWKARVATCSKRCRLGVVNMSP